MLLVLLCVVRCCSFNFYSDFNNKNKIMTIIITITIIVVFIHHILLHLFLFWPIMMKTSLFQVNFFLVLIVLCVLWF